MCNGSEARVSRGEGRVNRTPACCIPALSTSLLLPLIGGLQPILRESKEEDTAAMLDELTIEANEESFVIVLQNGRKSEGGEGGAR